MKRGKPLKRGKRLKSNAAAQRAWEDRTRQRLLEKPAHAPAVRAQIGRARRDTSEFQQSRAFVRDRAGCCCEAPTPACPDGRHTGEHAHHMQLRSQGGPDTTENLLWVCHLAHNWIHEHPADAAERGWIRRRSA